MQYNLYWNLLELIGIRFYSQNIDNNINVYVSDWIRIIDLILEYDINRKILNFLYWIEWDIVVTRNINTRLHAFSIFLTKLIFVYEFNKLNIHNSLYSVDLTREGERGNSHGPVDCNLCHFLIFPIKNCYKLKFKSIFFLLIY